MAAGSGGDSTTGFEGARLSTVSLEICDVHKIVSGVKEREVKPAATTKQPPDLI